MNKNNDVDYIIMDGKPHLGHWFGSYIFIHDFCWTEIYLEKAKKNLEMGMYGMCPEETEIRYKQFIVKPHGDYYNPLNCHGSVGIKYVIWGRAFKIKKLLKKNIKILRKIRINGKYKWKKK